MNSPSPAAAGLSRVPSLFSSAPHGGGACEFPILDELSGKGGRIVGDRWVKKVLVTGVVLALGVGLIALGWGARCPSPRFDGRVDALTGEVPAVTKVRSEPMARVHDAHIQAATIVEVPASIMETQRLVASGRGVSNAGDGNARIGDARPEKVHGAARQESAVRVAGKESVLKGRGGTRMAVVKAAAMPTRRLPPNAKQVETSVDADVQVIEAIVTRSR